MDKIIAKDLFLKYWKNAVILILAIFLFQQCNKTEELSLASEISKSKAKDYLQKSRLAKENLQGITELYEKKVDSVIQIETDYKIKLTQNSKIVKAKISDLKHYSQTDITEYYKERYNTKNGVIQSELGTTLKDTISRLLITDLIYGDGAKSEVKILREFVETKDFKFNLCNETVDSLKVGIETISKNYELANIEKDKVIDITEKILRKEKNKKNVWKLISAGVAIGAGYLLFVK